MTRQLKSASSAVAQDFARSPAVKGGSAFIVASACVVLANWGIDVAINGLRQFDFAEIATFTNGLAAAFTYLKAK